MECSLTAEQCNCILTVNNCLGQVCAVCPASSAANYVRGTILCSQQKAQKNQLNQQDRKSQKGQKGQQKQQKQQNTGKQSQQ